MAMNNGYNGGNEFMKYLEYLYSMGCTLDENGNVVPINNGNNSKTLSLTITIEDDDDE